MTNQTEPISCDLEKDIPKIRIQTMHEWTKHNERITEILTARKSENIKITIKTKLCCTFGFGEKKTCREHCYEDLVTVILKRRSW